jgi:hypothetical protein
MIKQPPLHQHIRNTLAILASPPQRILLGESRMKTIGIAFLLWIILTGLRVLVFLLWTKIVGSNWPRGYWVLLVPQIVLIFLFSILIVRVLPSQNPIFWLDIGIGWLIFTLAFEFIGVLVFEKGGLSLLFEGWKIWKGNIWVLVLLSHLFAPYITNIWQLSRLGK